MSRNYGMETMIEQMMAEEFYNAEAKFPPFASAPEGWAVIREELEESLEEYKAATEIFDGLWKGIRANEPIEDLTEYAKDMRVHVFNTIQELVQVAAMCKKFEAIGVGAK